MSGDDELELDEGEDDEELPLPKKDIWHREVYLAGYHISYSACI